MGQVLLAYSSPVRMDSYFKTEHLRKITEFTETREDHLRQILAEVRANGYCAVQDELEVGLVSVAVPLWGPAGNFIAAMNCSSVARRTDSREILRTRLALLKEFAQQVSAALARFPSWRIPWRARRLRRQKASEPRQRASNVSATFDC
jgi:IclR family pca regulon transcriptional regulator